MDGGEPGPISGFEPGDWPVAWSKEGRSLLVRRSQDLTIQIHRLDTLTGRRKLLFDLVPPDPAGVIGYAAMSADGKSYAYSFIRNLSELYLIEGLK